MISVLIRGRLRPFGLRFYPRPIAFSSSSEFCNGPRPFLHPSASSVADRDLVALHDDRNLPLPFRVLEHVIELRGILPDVVILRFITEGLTGLLGVRSAGLPVDDHFCPHVRPSVSRWSLSDRSDKIVTQVGQATKLNSFIYPPCRNKSAVLYVKSPDGTAC